MCLAHYASATSRGRTVGRSSSLAPKSRSRVLGKLSRLFLLFKSLDICSIRFSHREELDGAVLIVVSAFGGSDSA